MFGFLTKVIKENIFFYIFQLIIFISQNINKFSNSLKEIIQNTHKPLTQSSKSQQQYLKIPSINISIFHLKQTLPKSHFVYFSVDDYGAQNILKYPIQYYINPLQLMHHQEQQRRRHQQHIRLQQQRQQEQRQQQLLNQQRQEQQQFFIAEQQRRQIMQLERIREEERRMLERRQRQIEEQIIIQNNLADSSILVQSATYTMQAPIDQPLQFNPQQYQQTAINDPMVPPLQYQQQNYTPITQPSPKPSKFQTPIYYHFFFEWKQGLGSIDNTQLTIGQKKVQLSQLNKIKLMKEPSINDSQKIKLTHLTGDVLFSVDPKSHYKELPMHYYWFAKIITQKLYLKGCDLENTYIPQKDFSNVNVKNTIIDGILYKQSQYLKSWELRYVAITPEGLFSYKNETGIESFSIRKDSATEIWTRFDIHERMLVIKIHHNARKTEFGIPILDYCIDQPNNWLLAFYRLLYP